MINDRTGRPFDGKAAAQTMPSRGRTDPGASGGADAESIQLPFDIRTVWIGVRRRWWLMLICIVVAAGAGILGSLVFGQRTYEAETVLLYKVPRNPDGSEPPHANIATYLNMVKIQSTLASVRDKLNLPTSLATLGANCHARVDKNTELMLIQAEAKTPDAAAAIANELRSAFLKKLQTMRTDEVTRQIRDLETRLVTVQAELATAETAIRAFTGEHQIVDLDKQAYWLLDQQTQLEIQYEQSEVDRKRVELQAANVSRIIQQLQKRVADEKVAAAHTEGLGELDIRIRELRSSIDDERTTQANLVLLKRYEQRLHQLEDMLKKNAAVPNEVEAARADYERQKALCVDTPQITGWKGEMAKLQQVVRPERDEAMTASVPILQHMMMQEFSIQLEQVAAGEKATQFGTALQRTRDKLKTLPALQGRHTDLKRQVEVKEAEKKSIEQLLSGLRSAHQWEESGFTVVCEARPPALPTSSTHRKIAVAIAALGSLLGLGLVLSLELADSTVKSPADVGLRLSCPVLGELPLIEAPDGATFPRPAPAHAEAVRVVTERVRRSLPEPGACVLVTSAAPSEGKTTVAASMAWCLGQRGERVLLIDGHLRPADPGDGVCRVVSRTTQSLAGLSDYLVGSALPAETLVQPTDVAGVDWLPRGRCDVSPDLLASQRLRELLTQFSLQYTIVILDTGPVLSAIDTETLAGLADGAVLVVRSRLCRAAVLQETRARLEATGVTVLGTVLNAVEPAYSRLPRTRASSNGTGGSPA